MSFGHSPFQYVSLSELNLRGSRQALEKKDLRQQYKRTGMGTPSATKRRRILRQSTPLSNSYNSPCSSRLSTPSIAASSLENGEDITDTRVTRSRAYQGKISGEIGDRSGDEALNDMLKKYDPKQSYLYTPPPTISNCSPKGSSIFDEHSVASTVQYTSSPCSDNDGDTGENGNEDVTGKEGPLQKPTSDGPANAIIKYPQTLELCQEPPGTPCSWSDPSLLSDECSQIRGDVPWAVNSAIYQGSLHRAILIPEGPKFDATHTAAHWEYILYLNQLTSPIVTDQIFHTTEDQTIQIAEQRALVDPENRSYIKLVDLGMSNVGTAGDVPCDTLDLQAEAELIIPATTKSTSDPKVTCAVPTAQSSLEIYLKGSIENWSLDIPEGFKCPETIDAQSPSTSILMTTTEEDLEERVSWALSNDPTLAQILLSKLKDKLSFILPLFCEEEECSLLDFSQGSSYFGYERGTTRKPASSSAPSTGSKSSTGASIMTPATSADSGKDGYGNEEEEEEEEEGELSNSGRRPLKRPRVSNSRHPGDQERRRLRCHFHAKCPGTHIQKTCVLSGWLSIHNLRGHYSTHHTIIRCNKCFKEFERKTEKNQHQRACTADVPPPSLEVIDCDKTDELEEVLNTFRTWRLDNEEDEEMKSWIVKYKVQFVNNNMPTDDAHDSRELAKWYRIWRTLFPSLQTPVPSPFRNASISPGDLKLERWLEVFQSVIESKVEQNQPPPTDIPKQVDYYKDIIRVVYHITLPTPGSNSGSSSESSQPVDGRSVSTPAYSTVNTIPSRPNATDSSTPPNLCQGGSTNRVDESATSTIPHGGSQSLHCSPSTFSAPSSGSPLRSPCSAETRGACGESPVIMKSGQLRRASGSDTAIISPSPHRTLEFQARNQPVSQNSSSVPSQSGTTIPIHSEINTGIMMPPPSRSRLAPGISSQNTEQQPMQHFQARPLQFPLGSMAPGFASNDSTSLFSFRSMLEDQESQGWPGVQISHGQDLICQFCMDSGYSIASGTQPCFACGLPYTMQS